MPIMQIAHGRNQASVPAFPPPFFGEPLHRRHRGNNLHDPKRVRRKPAPINANHPCPAVSTK
jgi:hypothetical protein